MAAVSQHAMRRHPGGPLDSSTGIGPTYYAVSHQQALASNNNNDKSKKSWSQRLKINKSEKQLSTAVVNSKNYSSVEYQSSPQQPPQPPDPQLQSAVSRSMKYSDQSWYYGTVRGIPTAVPMIPAGVHHQQLFASPMREVAVVICSCPEYLNGTKKETKKASICKKCRGSRLPLTQIGGTMRIHSTTPIVHASRSSAGTVRLPNAYKQQQLQQQYQQHQPHQQHYQRPTILNMDNDPYDMMRRSRLVSPELQPINNILNNKKSNIAGSTISSSSTYAAAATSMNNNNKSRAKSSSPSRCRARSRKRSPSPRNFNIASSSMTPSPIGNKNQSNTTSPTSGLRSRSASRSNINNSGGWLIETPSSITDEHDNITNLTNTSTANNRRSILHCDLSAYELISKISHNNEFSPNGDDDLYNISPTMGQLNYNNININNNHNNSSTVMNNHGLDITELAGQRINLNSSSKHSNVHRNQQEYDKYDYEQISYPSSEQQQQQLHKPQSPKSLKQYNKNVSPVRPPRSNRKPDFQSLSITPTTINASSSSSQSPSSPISDGVVIVCNNSPENESSFLLETSLKSEFVLTQTTLSHISNDMTFSSSSPSSPLHMPKPTPNQQVNTIKSILKRRPSQQQSIQQQQQQQQQYQNNNNNNISIIIDSDQSSILSTSSSKLSSPLSSAASPTSQSSITSTSTSATILNVTNLKGTKLPMMAYHHQKKLPKTTTSDNKKLARGNTKVTQILAKNLSNDNINNNSANNNNNNSNHRNSTSNIPSGIISTSSSLANQTSSQTKEKRNSGSHFYLPMPQRKKVQFLVENEIIYDNLITIEPDDNETKYTGYVNTYRQINGEMIHNNNSVDDLLPEVDYSNDDDDDQSGDNFSISNVEINRQVSVTSSNSNNTSDGTSTTNIDTSTFLISLPSKLSFGKFDEDNDLPSPNRSILRRSFSDRRLSEPNDSLLTEKINFNDTTALRIKTNRNDSRNIFLENDNKSTSSTSSSSSSTIRSSRPKDPPPPPPPARQSTPKSQLISSTISPALSPPPPPPPPPPPKKPTTSILSTTNTNQIKNAILSNKKTNPARPPRSPARRLSTSSINKDLVNNDNCNNGVQLIQTNYQNSNVENDYEDYSYSSSTSTLSTASSSDNVKLVINNNNELSMDAINNHQISNDDGSDDNYNEQRKRIQANNEAFQGSRLFGNGISPSIAAKKTIVKIAPLIINRSSSEIHRLEIKNDDDDNYNDFPKKTSILINGDECYSTINVNDNQPRYHASVVVNGGEPSTTITKNNTNTVSINVTTPQTPEDLVFHNNEINSLLNGTMKSIIPIENNTTICSNSSTSDFTPYSNQSKTLITVDFTNEKLTPLTETITDSITKSSIDQSTSDIKTSSHIETKEIISNDAELLLMLRDPVEAVKHNLIPHVCGKLNLLQECMPKKSIDGRKMIQSSSTTSSSSLSSSATLTPEKPLATDSFIGKLLEDPTLGQLAEGLDNDIVAKLIENSLTRLKESRTTVDISGTKDEQDMNKLIDTSLQKVKEERIKLENNKKHIEHQTNDNNNKLVIDDEHDKISNRDSMSSANSFSSATYEPFDFDTNDLSDCYQSCSSELTTDEDGNITRSKFYQMLVDATLSEIEISTHHEDDSSHHYESIRLNGDPIYEEISDVPPPLPLCPPPTDSELDKKAAKSMFEGASKYDILSYLVDAKERGIVPEDSYTYNFNNAADIIIEEENNDKINDRIQHNRQNSDISSRISHISGVSDVSDDVHCLKMIAERKSSAEIERNDSGVGSETSKNSRSKYQSLTGSILNKNSPIHLCEDCDGPVETQITESGVMFAALVCRKCGKKRAERKEIVTEIIETEEKYSRDLQIILEEFYQPMLVAGLLTQEQLSAIFLNSEELLENSQGLADKMRDAFDISIEQGDDDLLTVNIGRLLLDAAPMLHAFESYCIRQAAASLLLANLEKEKELLRIFLRVSQMENTVLRRMNLNSFLMVPVQRVTKYPLLLARLYKVTPAHLDGRDLLKQAQEKIELHLNHMNREAKDVPTKLWRRISSSSPGRRSSCEIDMINIKLRKMAIDLLEWHHDEVRFPIEGKLLFTQPNDNNWRKGRTIKLTPINALLVTNGKPSASYKSDKALVEPLNFPRHTGIREASLLLVREKSGRYTLLREPLFLDRCIICTEADWEDYFEVQEISSKDTFIFKADDCARTKQWYTQLQYHSQGMGAWRKRRNALANIMINGMMMRS